MASSPGSSMKRVRARAIFSRIPSDEYGMSRCIGVPPPGVALTSPFPRVPLTRPARSVC